LILGIETSCDDTSAAVVCGREVKANIIASQTELHERFGGVVPEIASRRHLELMLPVLEEAFAQAKVTPEELTGIAVTQGPGLVGSLLVGISAAKSLALAYQLPLVGVHHTEGHLFANLLSDPKLEPPFLCLTVSGGHTDLILFQAPGRYQLLRRTRDDAAGEAFDKVARAMDLGYPGGPAIEKMAKRGDREAFPLPRGLSQEETWDFSFSGLKTATIQTLRKTDRIADLAASFQWAVVDVLVERTLSAAEGLKIGQVALSGGVAANSLLRSELARRGEEKGIYVSLPKLDLCTDNAAMIAAAGAWRLEKGERSGWDLNAVPNLPLPTA